MREKIERMKNEVKEINEWETKNKELPAVVTAAIRNYRGDLNTAIAEMESDLEQSEYYAEKLI